MGVDEVEVVGCVEIAQVYAVLGLRVGVDAIPRAILLLNIIIYHIIKQPFLQATSLKCYIPLKSTHQIFVYKFMHERRFRTFR